MHAFLFVAYAFQIIIIKLLSCYNNLGLLLLKFRKYCRQCEVESDPATPQLQYLDHLAAYSDRPDVVELYKRAKSSSLRAILQLWLSQHLGTPPSEWDDAKDDVESSSSSYTDSVLANAAVKLTVEAAAASKGQMEQQKHSTDAAQVLMQVSDKKSGIIRLNRPAGGGSDPTRRPMPEKSATA